MLIWKSSTQVPLKLPIPLAKGCQFRLKHISGLNRSSSNMEYSSTIIWRSTEPTTQITFNPGLSTENCHCLSKQKIQISAECSTKRWWMTICQSTNLYLISRPPFLNFRSGTVTTNQVCTISEPAFKEKSKKTKNQQDWKLPTIKLIMLMLINLTAEDLTMKRKVKKWSQLALVMIANPKSMSFPHDQTLCPFTTQDLPSVSLPWTINLMISMTTCKRWPRRGKPAVWN